MGDMVGSSCQCADLLTEGLSRGGVTEEALEDGGAIEARLLLGADRVTLARILPFKRNIVHQF